MKVVVPYTELNRATLFSVEVTANPRALFAKLDPNDEHAYGKLFASIWAQGETFCWIEHDIEIGPSTIYDFRACSYGYCAAPYPWTTDVGPAMGCTRFRDSFIAKYPGAVDEALNSGVGFRQFDIVFQRHVLVGKYGEQPHVHAPVIHHNPAQALRPDASPEPLMTIPGMTFPLQREGA